jgi:C-terminal processing protease CtpA/Prc
MHQEEPITLEVRSFNDLNNVLYGFQPSQFASTWQEPGRYKLIQDKPIYVMIDEACVSMCESFVDVLSSINEVTLIGKKTGGARSFVEFIQLNADLTLTVPSHSIFFSKSCHSRIINDNESVYPDIIYSETTLDLEEPDGILALIRNHYLENF